MEKPTREYTLPTESFVEDLRYVLKHFEPFAGFARVLEVKPPLMDGRVVVRVEGREKDLHAVSMFNHIAWRTYNNYSKNFSFKGNNVG